MKPDFGSPKAKVVDKELQEPWPASYTVWSKVANYFWWTVLGHLDARLNDTVVASIQRLESGILGKLKEFFFRVRGKDPLDPVLHSKSLMVTYLITLVGLVCDRIKMWLDAVIQQGKIDWQCCDCFRLCNPDANGYAQECHWNISTLRLEKATSSACW